MSSNFPLITTAISTEAVTTLALKQALKNKVYEWFTTNQSTIADSVDQRKLILPDSTNVEYIVRTMTPEFHNCPSVYDRTMICKEIYNENGIEVTALYSSYSNVYVQLRTRDTFIPLNILGGGILELPNAGIDVLDGVDITTGQDVY